MKQKTVTEVLEHDLTSLVLGIWERVVLRLIAEEAARLCDWRQGVTSLITLDSAFARAQLVQQNIGAVCDRVITSLLEQKKQLNAALQDAGHRELPTWRLKQELEIAIPRAVAGPAFVGVVAKNPFPAIWPQVANAIASAVHDTYSSTPEWELTNGLLLAEYVRTSPFSTAAHLEQSLPREGRMGLRGSLVRLPTLIERGAILDPQPSILPGHSNIRARNWSELFGALLREIRLADTQGGTVHQILRIEAPVPAAFPGTPEQFAAIRSAGYALYEQMVVAYMALSAMEQLLRAWANHCGVSHLKQGQPAPWGNWGSQLPLSDAARALVNSLYEPTGLNLRNRIMHGGLLEPAATSMETTMRAAAAAGIPGILTIPNDNPFSPRNIANHCLNVLAAIELEAPLLLSDSDRSWEASIALTLEEARWGYRNVYCDFLYEDATSHQRRLFRYLQDFAPGAAMFPKVGFHGWISGGLQISSRHFVQHMFLTLAFETLYRLTAQLMGQPALQLTAKGDVLRVQYRMLDSRLGGLYEEPFVQRIVAYLSLSDRLVARRVLALAVKIRNAVAHGAIVDFTTERWKGEGQILVKAMQLLMEAGIEHMTEEAAYYVWEERRASNARYDDPIADWYEAEMRIEEMLFA